MLLSAISKNLNWEILTKILFFLKDGKGFQGEKFWYYVSWLEGWSQKKQCIERNCLKRGVWTVCRFKGGALAKKIAMHVM